ncbi:MAG: hypothetical protein H0V34_13775 [Gammaproteobacteria bacterium]|nr:hypothetical protein [Gammaproteobacteria bacterium]
MFPLKAESIASHLVRAADAPALSRFTVYHACLNGEMRGEVRSVVPSWRLLEFLRGIKLLNVYSRIGALRNGDFFEFSAYVHGERLNLAIRTAEWSIFSNATATAGARATSLK